MSACAARKPTGIYVFEFSRRIDRERILATQALPKTWNRAQADAYDRQESARLYAAGSGIEKSYSSIEETVACYQIERASKLKQGAQRGARVGPYLLGLPEAHAGGAARSEQEVRAKDRER